MHDLPAQPPFEHRPALVAAKLWLPIVLKSAEHGLMRPVLMRTFAVWRFS